MDRDIHIDINIDIDVGININIDIIIDTLIDIDIDISMRQASDLYRWLQTPGNLKINIVPSSIPNYPVL